MLTFAMKNCKNDDENACLEFYELMFSANFN